VEEKNLIDEAQTVPSQPLVKPVVQKQNPLLIVLILLTIIFLGSTGYLAYQNMQLQRKVMGMQPTSNLSTNSTQLPTISAGNYDVETKFVAGSPCNDKNDSTTTRCTVDVYLKDKVSNKETYIFTTDNFQRNDTRVSEYRNGYIFYIKRTGNDNYPSTEWTDELWVYNVQQGQQSKITDSPGLTFSANPDGSLVSLIRYSKTNRNFPINNSISILSKENNWQPKEYPLDVAKCVPDPKLQGGLALGFDTWQQNTSFLWGGYGGGGGSVMCYWKLDISSSDVVYYTIQNPPKNLLALNFDKLVSVYVDIPFLGSADVAQQWTATHPTYSLYLYSLQTGKSTTIGTYPSNLPAPTNFIWDTPTVLHFTSPQGTDTVYTLQ
jgi:hypothetical protein